MAYIPFEVSCPSPVPTSLFPRAYAVFPFTAHRSLPWTTNAGGTFRIRRVGEWLGTDASEDAEKTGGLVEGKGHIFSMAEYVLTPKIFHAHLHCVFGRESKDLKNALLGGLPRSVGDRTGSNRIVTAT